MEKQRLNIPLRVRNLIDRHGTNEPERIADDLGILIYPRPVTVDATGVSTCCLRRKVIVVEEDVNEYEQTITIAHELAHILLKHKRSLMAAGWLRVSRPAEEAEADLFAACLLCPSMTDEERALFPSLSPSERRNFIRRHLYS